MGMAPSLDRPVITAESAEAAPSSEPVVSALFVLLFAVDELILASTIVDQTQSVPARLLM